MLCTMEHSTAFLVSHGIAHGAPWVTPWVSARCPTKPRWMFSPRLGHPPYVIFSGVRHDTPCLISRYAPRLAPCNSYHMEHFMVRSVDGEYHGMYDVKIVLKSLDTPWDVPWVGSLAHHDVCHGLCDGMCHGSFPGLFHGKSIVPRRIMGEPMGYPMKIRHAMAYPTTSCHMLRSVMVYAMV